MKISKSKVCFLLSGALVLIFLVNTAMDYAVYSSTLNSAPFWVWIMMNALYFLLPSLIALICGLFFKKR